MLAIFTVVSSEMMPVGLLTAMAHGLGVSDGVTGLSLTVTGLIAAALAPFTPRLVARRERRAVLAPNFAVPAVGRILLGGRWASSGAWSRASARAWPKARGSPSP
ncbi:hypothetical protein [Kitasatospora sp. NPDC088351]|uniref:hypothetical protein n=1 Tax=Kitasatospora sp. NPDC088351 TaxID=3155180 RepID=UPI003416A55A